VGQPFEVRLDLVNISRTSASLVNIQDILPQEFQITASQPEILREGSSVQLKESKLEPFTVKTIKLTCQPAKPGTFTLNPLAVYIDDLGQTKTRMLRSATITAKHAEPAFEILPGRLTTGYTDLDRLLLGGIPEKFAVVLTAPSSDERQILVKHFLEAGGRANETTLYITCEPASIQELTKQYQNLCLIDCSPQTNQPQQNPPNIIKLKGIDNLTNIEIALTKYFRTLDPKQTTPRRNCIDILSDVLLQHHAVITRKWLSALLPNLKQQGFAVLAVVNPDMHSQEEVQAILDLFDGEIQISEKETTIGIEKVLRVRRLLNQKYLKNELTLTG
jgi:KaiC/GvpD/RAD55 family RecA-like ATPase